MNYVSKRESWSEPVVDTRETMDERTSVGSETGGLIRVYIRVILKILRF